MVTVVVMVNSGRRRRNIDVRKNNLQQSAANRFDLLVCHPQPLNSSFALKYAGDGCLKQGCRDCFKQAEMPTSVSEYGNVSDVRSTLDRNQKTHTDEPSPA